jgi:hypothetical protein
MVNARRRELAHRMKQTRLNTGKTASEITQRLGNTLSDVSRMESGAREVPDNLIVAYLTLCGLSYQELRHHLELSRESQAGRGYWLATSAESIDIQSSFAHELFSYHPETIPALLAAESHDARPAIVVDDDRCHVIVLHERTIQRSSIEQLLKIVFVAGLPNYALYLVPEPHSFGSAFHLLSSHSGQSVVYVPAPYRSGLFVDHSDGIRAYTAVMEDILGAAVSANETQDIIVGRIEDASSSHRPRSVKAHPDTDHDDLAEPRTVKRSRLTSGAPDSPAPGAPALIPVDTAAARSQLALAERQPGGGPHVTPDSVRVAASPDRSVS